MDSALNQMQDASMRGRSPVVNIHATGAGTSTFAQAGGVQGIVSQMQAATPGVAAHDSSIRHDGADDDDEDDDGDGGAAAW